MRKTAATGHSRPVSVLLPRKRGPRIRWRLFVFQPRGPRTMSNDNQVMLGEVYRLVVEIREEQKAQNGRLRSAETDIAVLKDRGDQSKDSHARYAGWGGVIASAGSLLWQFLHKP